MTFGGPGPELRRDFWVFGLGWRLPLELIVETQGKGAGGQVKPGIRAQKKNPREGGAGAQVKPGIRVQEGR